MYDPITSALISSSPALSGLDLADLPKRLTEAYAEIVAARISLRSVDGGVPERLAVTLTMLRRLAVAHETYVALLPDRENRRAAAFVAGSAHQATLLGRQRTDVEHSYLEGHGIAAEVSASLLFLIADAHSDAAESAKRISVHPDLQGTIAGQLLIAIRLLCEGRLETVRRLNDPAATAEEPADRAVEVLYLEIFKGVRRLAARMLTRVDIAVDQGGIEPPSASFLRVKAAGLEELNGVPGVKQAVFSSFPGPVHLANLLLAVERDIGESALARVPSPKGTDGEGWWPVVRRMARRRPFLWSNHKQAIRSGYLEPGVSAAMSFPTGGGKSTLAQLKIASCLLAGRKVVFLAPTHALVDQTTRDLRAVFNSFEIVADIEDEASLTDLLELPEVIVTTPERCLMLLSSQPDAFADLGLVVFDECHLLHPKEADKSRRSVDAMLTILNLATQAKGADFLLISAMMRNADEIAGWIAALTARPCMSLDLAWKPTRQVRGCVVYQATRIQELNNALGAARRANPKAVGVPAAVAKTLTAQPFGFFSLLQTWATEDRSDYTLFGLLPDSHLLSTGKNVRGWHLTPNGNYTSALLAAASAKGGMKTLVFVQTVPLAESAAKETRNQLEASAIELTDDEAASLNSAIAELGGAEFLFLELTEKGAVNAGAVSHHSLLLKEERIVHESLFKRPNGSQVMVATSTVAQGMNFPAEVVLISGDSRFDPEKEKLAQLEAHELLNAAGRAGRAGENSQGFVLVVPSRVVDFDDKSSLINSHWMTLRTIFSQSDQCLDIEDPLTALLDRIHSGMVDGMGGYLLSRLPVAIGMDSGIDGLINRSLASFKARQRGDKDWVAARIATAIDARNALAAAGELEWLDAVAGLTGVPAPILQEISDLFADSAERLSLPEAMSRLFDWLQNEPATLFALLRSENVSDLFGTLFDRLADDTDRAAHALPILRDFLNSWMRASPLCEIEVLYPDKPDMGRLKHARHFALRLVPDLAFLAGLPARLLKARSLARGADVVVPLHLEILALAVKEGCDSPEALAVRLSMKPGARPPSRNRFETLRPHFPASQPGETFDATVQRFRQAVAIEAFMEGD